MVLDRAIFDASHSSNCRGSRGDYNIAEARRRDVVRANSDCWPAIQVFMQNIESLFTYA